MTGVRERAGNPGWTPTTVWVAGLLAPLILAACSGPPEGGLRGRFLLEGQESHEGTVVSLLGSTWTATTDENGDFRMVGVSPGAYTLLARHEGFQVFRKANLVVPRGESLGLLEITLAREVGDRYALGAGEIRGSVLLEGSVSSGGAYVNLLGTPHYVATRSDGSFELSGIPPGSYELAVTKSGYLFTEPIPVSVVADHTTQMSEIVLRAKAEEPARGSLEGRVELLGQEDHSGVIVALQNTSLMTFSRPDGSFRIGDIPSGTQTLRLSREGYRPETREVEIGAGGALLETIPLSPLPAAGARGGVVRGRALLEGRDEHGGIQVLVEGTSITADTTPRGEYALIGLPSGTFTIAFSYPGFLQERVGRVVVEEGTTRELSDALLKAGVQEQRGAIYGVARLEDGGIPAGITVSLIETGEVVVTDAQGRYRFTQLAAGSHSILATYPGYLPASAVGVTLVAGEVRPAPELVLAREVDHPRVVRTLPADGARKVALTDETLVVITFDRMMDTERVIRAVGIDPPVTVSYSFGDGSGIRTDTLELHLLRGREPSVAFNTTYRVVIDTGAADLSGNRLKEPHVFSFTTGGPRVLATGPADGGVVIPGGSAKITFEVNEPLDMRSVERAVQVRPRPPTQPVFFQQVTRRGAVVRVDVQLREGQEYSVSLSSRLETKSGLRLDNTPYQWRFRTARFSDLPTTLDLVQPEVR